MNTTPAYTGLRDEPRIEHAVNADANNSTVCVRCGAALGTWAGMVPNPQDYKPCSKEKKR